MILRHRFNPALPVGISLCLLLVGAMKAAEPDPDSWSWNDPRDLKIPGLRHGTIESPSMKRTVGFNVYLPPQYEKEPDRRFPVVYFLHGAGGTESSDAGLANLVHAEIVAGRIQPVIYVFPNGGQTSGYRDWTNGNVRSETLLIREVLPLVDQDYRTIARSEGRGICGFSMGGAGALRLTLKYPDLFGAAASLAAAVEKSPDEKDGDNVYVHAGSLSRESRDRLRLYLVVGEDDFLYPRHPPFLKHLKEQGIASTFVVHSKVGHDLGALNRLSGDSMIRQLDREMQTQLDQLEKK